MSRRELREHIFLMLFRVEFFNDEDLSEQLKNFMDDSQPLSEEDDSYIQKKYLAIKEHIQDLDELINEKTTGWKTTRMSKVDLTIIRLGAYEIKFDEEVPDSVAINEAVELAKKFGSDESPAFINGVLAKINE